MPIKIKKQMSKQIYLQLHPTVPNNVPNKVEQSCNRRKKYTWEASFNYENYKKN